VKRIILLLLLCGSAVGQDYNNQQDGDLNTNNQNSNVNSNNVSTTNVGAGSQDDSIPVNSAISPSFISNGNDSCLKSVTGGIQIDLLGISSGVYREDNECNRRKDAKVLKELGMSVAAVARMCQSEENWSAMFLSGTPCPIIVNGKLTIGRAAYLAIKKNPEFYIPGYKSRKEEYTKILGLGDLSYETAETIDSGSSISERFRSATRLEDD